MHTGLGAFPGIVWLGNSVDMKTEEEKLACHKEVKDMELRYLNNLLHYCHIATLLYTFFFIL